MYVCNKNIIPMVVVVVGKRGRLVAVGLGVSGSGTGRGLVVGEGHLSGFDAFEVLHQNIVVPLHLLHRLSTAYHGRHIFPSVGCVLVEYG